MYLSIYRLINLSKYYDKDIYNKQSTTLVLKSDISNVISDIAELIPRYVEWMDQKNAIIESAVDVERTVEGKIVLELDEATPESYLDQKEKEVNVLDGLLKHHENKIGELMNEADTMTKTKAQEAELNETLKKLDDVIDKMP